MFTLFDCTKQPNEITMNGIRNVSCTYISDFPIFTNGIYDEDEMEFEFEMDKPLDYLKEAKVYRNNEFYFAYNKKTNEFIGTWDLELGKQLFPIAEYINKNI